MGDGAACGFVGSQRKRDLPVQAKGGGGDCVSTILDIASELNEISLEKHCFCPLRHKGSEVATTEQRMFVRPLDSQLSPKSGISPSPDFSLNHMPLSANPHSLRRQAHLRLALFFAQTASGSRLTSCEQRSPYRRRRIHESRTWGMTESWPTCQFPSQPSQPSFAGPVLPGLPSHAADHADPPVVVVGPAFLGMPALEHGPPATLQRIRRRCSAIGFSQVARRRPAQDICQLRHVRGASARPPGPAAEVAKVVAAVATVHTRMVNPVSRAALHHQA